MVHDPWFYNVTTEQRARYSAIVDNKGKPVLEFTEVPLDTLVHLAKRIHDFDQRAWETLDAILQKFRGRRGWFVVARLL